MSRYNILILPRAASRRKKLFVRALLAVLVMVAPCLTSAGQAAVIGDLMILGFQADSPDSLSFVALADIPAGTQFFITDNSATNISGSYLNTENAVTWTVPAGGLSRGAVVVGTDPGSGNESIDFGGTTSGRLSGISNDGDQLFIFQGTSVSGTAIYAVNGANGSPGWITTGSANSNISYLPTAFSGANGNRDLSDWSNSDNYEYTGSRQFATIADARAAINTQANWTVSDSAFSSLNSTDFTNNSAIAAPASAAFGRLMQSATPSITVGLTKTGANNTVYTATPSSTGVSITADGVIGTGAVTENISVQMVANANGSAATGVKSYNVEVDNTADFASGASTGFNDANDTVAVSATVLSQRSVTQTGGPTNLGTYIVGTAVGGSASFGTSGDDNNRTRVNLGASSAADSNGISLSGSANLFNSAGSTGTRGFSGSFGTAGAKSGALSLAVTTAELAGVGDTTPYTNATANYIATVLDRSNGSFLESSDSNSLTLDFGDVALGSLAPDLAFEIYNLLATSGFTAGLDLQLLDINGVGDVSVLTTDVGAFSDLAGDSAHSFLASINTNSLGTFSATYTFGVGDHAGITGGAFNSAPLSLTLTGAVVPEPSTLALALCASVTLLGVKLRRGSWSLSRRGHGSDVGKVVDF